MTEVGCWRCCCWLISLSLVKECAGQGRNYYHLTVIIGCTIIIQRIGRDWVGKR
jgi:hypothetical protein